MLPLVFRDRARDVAGRGLVPSYGLGTPGGEREIEAQRAIVGLRISHLPDFLADRSLVGASPAERLAEVLERQVQLITGLWHWQSAAFSLRFMYRPERAGIEVAVLARLLVQHGDVSAAAGQLLAELERQLRGTGLTVRTLASVEDLRAVQMPLSAGSAGLPYIVEVRQHEDVAVFPWVNNAEAYVVYPYWQPNGSFLQPFEAMVRQAKPCAINLHLEPTRLADLEYQALTQAAAKAQTVADWNRQGFSAEGSGRWVDPQASIVARIYTAQLRRLLQPFVILAQVASHDRFAAVNVAQTLGAAISARGRALRTDDDLASGFDMVRPQSDAELQAAARTFHHLVLTPWGQSHAADSPSLARLPYLADAHGAAALFRFPIAVQSGIPGIEVREARPEVEAVRPRARAAANEVHLGDDRWSGAITVKLDDLCRHSLIAGSPGSGKTNTCLYLLHQLQAREVPFLVVEPAKTEYRGLIERPGFEDLLVFTLGDESTSPFRLNPFELLPGVRLEVHLEALNVAINAALPQFGVLPSIVEEALEEVYARHGWRLADRGSAEPGRLFPTMAEFRDEAIRAAEGRGYRGELRDNIIAAIKGRIGSLLRGSKGRMFNCRRSLPLDILLSRPVILELDSLSDDAKALTMMFLLILLREFRQTRARDEGHALTGAIGKLHHFFLIEEAHRVLENVAATPNPEVAADTRARAVRAMTDFLVEMRAYGEGLLIAEQSPEKLAPDAVRNTNLKIGHALPGRQDREALANAMIMDEVQERFLGKLPVGEAAVFRTGFEKATFMTVPDVKRSTGHDEFLPDSRVRDHMAAFRRQHLGAYLPFDGCRFCGEPCLHRERVEPLRRNGALILGLRQAVKSFEEHPSPEHQSENWRQVASACRKASALAGALEHPEAAYCFLAHEIDFPFTEYMRRSFVRAWEGT